MEYLEFQRAGPVLPGGPALLLEGALPGRARRRRDETTVVVAAPALERHPGHHPPLRWGDLRVGAEETRLRRSRRGVDAEHRLDPHDPAADATNIAYTRAFWEGAARFSNGQTYFNFPGLLEEGDAAVRSSYGANHARLARISGPTTPRTASA